MLNETVDRVTPEGVDDSMPLLDAFLNPPAFFDTETSAKEAAGNIIRGMTRQVGNELDEFVTESLRNNLLTALPALPPPGVPRVLLNAEDVAPPPRAPPSPWPRARPARWPPPSVRARPRSRSLVRLLTPVTGSPRSSSP
jgi:hypothetical protein